MVVVVLHFISWPIHQISVCYYCQDDIVAPLCEDDHHFLQDTCVLFIVKKKFKQIYFQLKFKDPLSLLYERKNRNFELELKDIMFPLTKICAK